MSYRYFQTLTPLSFYPPSERMKVSNRQNFSLASLCDNEIIKKYVRNFRLNRENMESVYHTLLEIEDITEMSDYPELAQKDVVIKWTERRRYCIQV